MKSVVSLLYGPVFWTGAIGLAAWLVGYRHASLWVLPPLLLLALGVSFLAERYLPYDASWNRDHGDSRRDILHALVNEALYLAGLAVFPALAGHLQLGPWRHSTRRRTGSPSWAVNSRSS